MSNIVFADIEPPKVCKACFGWIMEHGEKITAPHHIKSRGAGGGDDPANLLQLCFDCHTYFHNNGWVDFIKEYDHLEEKVRRALKR